MAEKRKTEKLTTPAGEVKFARLDKPGLKYKKTDEYEYSASLYVSKADAEKINARAQAIAEAGLKEAIAAAKTPKERKALEACTLQLPVTAEEDNETGEPTGRYVLKSATNAVDTKGRSRTVPIYDAQLKQVTGVSIGRGSVIKLSCNISPYQMPSTSKYGVKLYLNGAQIIKLVEFGSGDASNDFGVEDGYVAIEEPAGGSKPAGGGSDGDDESPF